MKKIVAIILARGGSKGIPNKNIISFCGKPLVVWSIQQALSSKKIDKVYVSSDDKKILDLSWQFGAHGIKRPKVLARDTSTSEEALLHAIDQIEALSLRPVDAVVFLQPTSPLRDTFDIDGAIEDFIKNKLDSLFSAALLDDFCIWKKNGVHTISYSYDYKHRGRRQERDPLYLENGSIYIFKPKILRKYCNRLGDKIGMHLMDYFKSYEIDKIEDLEICEFFMRTKILNSSIKVIDRSNIKLIVYDFDGVFTDNKVLMREDGCESVFVNRADGLAIDLIRNNNIPQLILSTEKNKVIEARAKKLGINFIQGAGRKYSVLKTYCNKKGINIKNVLYVGNDINDLEVMQKVGYPICPEGATDAIKKISLIALTSKGGDGVARELLNYLGLNNIRD